MHISSQLSKNPCPRCGLERIIAKTWIETINSYRGESTLTHTQTVCPDADCQAKVEATLEANRVRLEDIEKQKLERERLTKQTKPASTDKR